MPRITFRILFNSGHRHLKKRQTGSKSTQCPEEHIRRAGHSWDGAIDKLDTLSDDREVAKFSQNSCHCTFRNQSFKINIINSPAAGPTLKQWRNRSGHKSDTAAIIFIPLYNQYQPLSKAYLWLYSHKVMPAWTLAPWQSSLPQKELCIECSCGSFAPNGIMAWGPWIRIRWQSIYSTRIGNIFTTYTFNRLNGLTKFGKIKNADTKLASCHSNHYIRTFSTLGLLLL